MPLYEYRCAGCEERFEVLQAIGAGAAGEKCPACGGEDLARQHSTFAGSIAGRHPEPAPSMGCCRGTASCPFD